MKQNIWELSGLFEGDIMDSRAMGVPEMSSRNGVKDGSLRWPGGEVPYNIHSDFGKSNFIFYSSIDCYETLLTYNEISRFIIF